MPLKVTKKGSESSFSLVARFCRKVKKSGILTEVRKRQYFKRPLSALAKKRAALKRLQLQKQYQENKKLGKL